MCRAAAILVLLGAAARTAMAGKVEVLTLDNGLTVVLAPEKGAADVAVGLALRHGRQDDPEGKEGLAEVAMRVLVLAKAGTVAERAPDVLQSVDAKGLRCLLEVDRARSDWAVRLAPDSLPAHLAEVAARWTGLEPDERLLGSVKASLARRREGTTTAPAVASVFRARIEALPEVHANRPWGTEDGVAAVDLDDVRAALKAALATRGSVLAIVGDFDPSKTKSLVKQALGAIPPSDPSPASVPSVPIVPGTVEGDPVKVVVTGRLADRTDAALVIAGPAPVDEGALAPWLVLAARLADRLSTSDAVVDFDPSREPGLLTMRRPAAAGEEGVAAVRPLSEALEEAQKGAVGAKDLLAVKKWFQLRLGMASLEGGVNFGLLDRAAALARLHLLGWDAEEVFAAVKKLKVERLHEIVGASAVRSALAGR